MKIDSLFPALEGWMSNAACSNRPYEWFAVPDVLTADNTEQTKIDILKGINVCKGCPVIDSCLAGADHIDLYFTVRGGQWPTGLTKYKPKPAVKAPEPEPEPASDPYYEPDLCPHGHDKKKTGYYMLTRCQRCNYLSKNQPRDEKRKALRALVWQEWNALDQCSNGHDLGPVEDRMGGPKGPYCYMCRRQGRAQAAKRYRAKVKTAVV